MVVDVPKLKPGWSEFAPSAAPVTIPAPAPVESADLSWKED